MVLNFTLVLSHYYYYYFCIIIMDDDDNDKIALEEQQSLLCTDLHITGGCGGVVVKVLCYKSEGCWFNSRWSHWNFSVT
jgi:hypothetical protein